MSLLEINVCYDVLGTGKSLSLLLNIINREGKIGLPEEWTRTILVMIQAGGEGMTEEIHKLCRQVWRVGKIGLPEEWTRTILVTIA